ncbi:MAG: SDR family NAD(P)-dependent oxidoreductase [Rickettsiales bacterium]|jgi:NAD(P)-dependent dehydrogenase (short-subunit alcohol dehydrogenase family)
MGRVQDQVAIVTGAAKGLGEAIALRLAQDGAKLVMADIDGQGLAGTATAIREAGGEAVTVVGDITEEEPAAALIEAAIEHFGQIDILVNNVGGSRNAKIWDMPVEDWDHTIKLNLRGTFLCTRAAVPHMMRRKRGKIICLSSGAREGTPWTAYYQGGSAYSACKAGVHGFMRDLALELAEFNINVNCVAPGPIDTEKAGANLRKMNETVDFSPNRMTPLGRLGLPVEVANAVLFLASDEASYVSGHTLAVAGGR